MNLRLLLVLGGLCSAALGQSVSVWSIRPTPSTENLWGVTSGVVGASASDTLRVVAVGESGTILYSDTEGESWLQAVSGTTQWLTAVYHSVGHNRFFAVGDGGIILSSPDGIAWTSEASPTTARLNAVGRGPIGGDILAVGEAGAELVKRGSDGVWRRIDVDIGDRWLRAIGGVAVGQGGSVLVPDANDGPWTALPVPATFDLEAWATGVRPWNLAAVTIVVGAEGTILQNNPPDWTIRPSGTTERLRGVAYRSGVFFSMVTLGVRVSAGEFFVVGTNGTILRSPDGDEWLQQVSPTTRNLNAASAIGSYVVAVGDGGTILRTGGSGAAPVIAAQPTFGYDSEGRPYIEATVGGEGALSYQWLQQSAGAPYPAGNDFPRQPLSTPHFNRASGTLYRLVAANAFGAAWSDVVVANRFLNLSSRGYVGPGENVLIGGFAVGGPGTGNPRTFLIRAVGPALGELEVGNPLPTPVLKLFREQTVIASNRGWESQSDSAAISAAAEQVHTFPFRSGAADSALLVDLPEGIYTAHVETGDENTGIALLEIYEVSSPGLTRLTNVSARARVRSGEGVLIGGLVLDGGVKRRVLVRAAGPALAGQGVASPLPQPRLTLYRGATPIRQATNWSADANSDELRAEAENVGAFAFAPGSADAAMIVELEPGPYTAIVNDVTGAEGVALVEVYELPLEFP